MAERKHEVTSGTNVPVESVRWNAVVVRCGCGDPESHSKHGLPCPTPRAVEDLGTVALQSKSLLQRIRYRMIRFFSPTAHV